VAPGLQSRRIRSWAAACVAAVLVCTPACAARLRDPLARPSVIDARERHVRIFQADLAGIFAVPTVQRGLVAVHVASLDRHDVLFRYNADRLVMPASNMKIATLAATAERLGWDYTFETTIAATGPLVDGTLRGDLVVRGNGDPSLNARQVEPIAVLDGWADQLAAHGIRRIAGRLVGDDNAFDEQSFGQGWSWEDLHDGYSAPVGALQIYEDAVTLTLAPGAAPGTPADAALATPGSGWAIDNRAVTGTPGSPLAIVARRIPGAFLVHVSGSIPYGSQVVTRALAVDNPTTYFVGLLAAALERRGLTIGGGTADIDDLPAGSVSPASGPLVTYRSPPLREIAHPLMKASQNLYGETLLRAVGRVEGRVATAADGKAAVMTVLRAWGAPADSLVMADGSGLSRYNYATADLLVAILRRMYGDRRHREPWVDALAVSGEAGTLRKRFVGTPGQGRVRAKTGAISNVRALSGYVPAANGEQLVFSIIVNNVTATSDEIYEVVDAAVLRLAAFTR
jgi:D-alanyl-D-alanine carboxypeptidase/D-alanyl-D-alanine-endopeptidase (penicillin-binding protein 4)